MECPFEYVSFKCVDVSGCVGFESKSDPVSQDADADSACTVIGKDVCSPFDSRRQDCQSGSVGNLPERRNLTTSTPKAYGRSVCGQRALPSQENAPSQ